MRKENYASIWLGNLNSPEDLKSYVEQIYNDDGDINSFFIDDFKLGYYDHDFEEVYFNNDNRNNITALLEPLSYSKSFIEKIEDKDCPKYNAVICLYDFQFEGKNYKANNTVEFIGAYPYNKF